MKRVSFEYPEIDSLQLQQSLKDYAFPRDRVTKLLATGDLIRIKKGIYIDPHSQYPYSKESSRISYTDPRMYRWNMRCNTTTSSRKPSMW
jgi:hypothetical protein